MEITGPLGCFEGSVRDENICPDDDRASSALGSKRCRKDRKCDLRKSLAWNPAFFTEEGVLDPSELSVISGSVIKPNCKVPCNSHVGKSPGMAFDKFYRNRLSNVKEKVSCKRQPVLMSRSNEKDKLSFSEASTHNELPMLMCSKKMTLMKGMSKDLPSMNAGHTRTSSVSKKMHLSCGLPSALKQAKQPAVKMQSPKGKFKNAETEKCLVQKEKCIGQLNSNPSSSTKSQSESCSYSAALTSSISHEPHLFGMPSVPVQAKPSALRMPSPSLGFFQQGIPSRTNQSQKTSQVHIPNVSSFTTTSILKKMARFKHPEVQNDQQSSMAPLPLKADVNFAKARSTKICMSANGPVIPYGNFEACTDNMSMKHSDINDDSYASARESSNCRLENGKVGMTTCVSSQSSNELATCTCSQPQIGNKYLTAENMMISQFLHSSCSQRAASSNQWSVKSVASVTSEMCTTSEICFYEANESFSNTKLNVLMEPREEPQEPYHVENGVEHYHAPTSQVQQATPSKAIAREASGTSSQDVKLLASEEWRLRDDLQLYQLRNNSGSVKGDGTILPKKVSLDRLKQVVPLKHQLNAVPFSDEWIAAIEAYGEDILKVKTGTVQNSPTEKAPAEPGPWSPVKKAQDVGPFDCTKYTRPSAPSTD